MTLEMPNGVVSKSFIPPKTPGGTGTWMRATQLGPKKLRRVVDGQQYKSRGLSDSDKEFKSMSKDRRDLFNQAGQKGAKRTINGRSIRTVDEPDLPGNMHGAFIPYGGKRTGGTIMMNPHTSSASRVSTATHEMAHAAPRRSSYRMHQIVNNPQKIGREEGRADLASGARWTRPQPPGAESGYHQASRSRYATWMQQAATGGRVNPSMIRGYRDTQNRAGNIPRRERITGNPQITTDLYTAGAVGGAAGGYAYSKHKEKVAKSMEFLDMPGTVSKAAGSILKPLKSAAAGIKPPATPRATTGGMLKPLTPPKPKIETGLRAKMPRIGGNQRR